MRPHLFSSIELLEDRIAPASLITSFRPNSIKYTDVDGDLVTVSFTKSFITSANVDNIFTLVSAGSGAQLESINLGLAPAPAKLAGMGITVSAKKAPGGHGNGLVNVGLINAPNIPLGSVKVGGDLGAIDAGSASTASAVRGLTLDSFGALGTSTQAAGGNLVSTLTGNLPKLTVSGNVEGEFIDVSGSVTTVSIKGNLDGSSQPGVAEAGAIFAGGNIKTIDITGSLIGNDAQDSGVILTAGGNITTIDIGMNLDGSLGSAGNSGYIVASGSVKTVNIGGNMIGGAGEYSGAIQTGAGIGSVSVGGSIEGGAALYSGAIEARSTLTSLTVGQNLTAGATVRAGEQIGTITIKGAIAGTSAAPVVISAQGPGVFKGADLAIGGLAVTGNIDYGVVLAGYDRSLAPQDPNAQIGPVSVKGSFMSSDLVAGVQGTMNAGSFVFGTSSDAIISNGEDAPSTTVLSKIASVTIAGSVSGDAITGASYGITAEYIASLKVGATVEPLLSGPNNDLFSTSHEITLASNVAADEVAS